MFMQHMGSSGGGDGGVKEEAEESKAAGPSRKVAAPRKDKGRDLAERFM